VPAFALSCTSIVLFSLITEKPVELVEIEFMKYKTSVKNKATSI